MVEESKNLRYTEDESIKNHMVGLMKTSIQKLQNEMRALSLVEGSNKTGILFVTAYRFTTEKIQMPKIENPYLYSHTVHLLETDANIKYVSERLGHTSIKTTADT